MQKGSFKWSFDIKLFNINTAAVTPSRKKVSHLIQHGGSEKKAPFKANLRSGAETFQTVDRKLIKNRIATAQVCVTCCDNNAATPPNTTLLVCVDVEITNRRTEVFVWNQANHEGKGVIVMQNNDYRPWNARTMIEANVVPAGNYPVAPTYKAPKAKAKKLKVVSLRKPKNIKK